MNTIRNHPIPFIIAFVILAALITGIAINSYNTVYYNNYIHESFKPRDYVRVYVDGILIADTHNIVTSVSYEYLFCKMFNDTTACSNTSSGGVTGATLACPDIEDYGVAAAFCTADGTKLYQSTTVPVYFGSIGASTSSSTPLISDTSCPSLLNSNGFQTAKGTTTHSVSQNSIILSNVYTNTGSTVTITKACLFTWFDTTAAHRGQSAIPIAIGNLENRPLAEALFTGVVIANSQAVTIQWTFNF